MQTGIVRSWQVNPLDIGPVYPFVGYELALVAICAVLWVVYTAWQIRFEHERYVRESEHLGQGEVLGRAIERQVLFD